MVKYLIIGGGVAGLSAAITLARKGEKPLLLEGGTYPSHKVCGEFISPAALPFIKECSIEPVPVYRMQLHTNRQTLQLNFPNPSASLSHWTLDPALAAYAQTMGATIRTSTTVSHLHYSGAYHVTLASGEQIEAEHLIVATGRLPGLNLPSTTPQYTGLKVHLEGIDLDGTLEMFSVRGAYFGLTPIEEGKCNLACLALKHKPFDPEQIGKAHPKLEKLLRTSQPCFDWMEVQVPSFGLKSTPAWKNAYFIGDAAGTVPPASGNGLTLAILGGMRAAEYATQGRDADFKKDWSRFFRKRLWMGQLLHTALLRPYLLNTFIRAQSPFSQLAQMIYQLSR